MDDPAAVDPAASPTTPTLGELFIAFLAISLSGFGGALPWARRKIVEQRGWMTADEFNEAFSLSSFLPGPNLVNFAVVFGSRIRGSAGAALAFVGLLGPPVLIVTALGVLYSIYGEIETLGRILTGIAAAAVGLMIAMIAKMAAPFLRRWRDPALLVVLAAFIAVGVLRWPLPSVLIVLAPISVALAFWVRR